MDRNKFSRYAALHEAGIAPNRTTLARWIKTEGFPPGFKLGKNYRVYSGAAVLDWLIYNA